MLIFQPAQAPRGGSLASLEQAARVSGVQQQLKPSGLRCTVVAEEGFDVPLQSRFELPVGGPPRELLCSQVKTQVVSSRGCCGSEQCLVVVANKQPHCFAQAANLRFDLLQIGCFVRFRQTPQVQRGGPQRI